VSEFARTSDSNHPWTKGEVVEWFRTHYLKEGRTPTGQYRRENLGPPSKALGRLYGDPGHAYEDAGVPPPTRKPAVAINVRLKEIRLRDLREQKYLTVRCLHCDWAKNGDAITMLDAQTRHISKHGYKKRKRLKQTSSYT